MLETGNKFTIFHEYVARKSDVSAIDELRLYIGPQKFNYLAFTDGQIVIAKSFHYKRPSSVLFHIDILDQIMDNAEKLNKIQPTKVEVYYNTSDFTFVPSALFNSQETTEILGFNTSTINLIPKHRNIPSQDMTCVFGIPKYIDAFIHKHWNNAIIHFGTEKILDLLPIHEEPQIVYLHIEKGEFDFYMYENQKLKIANSFEFSNREEFAYYVLFVLEQLGANPETMPVYMLGDIDENSPYYNIIYKYLRYVHIIEPKSIHRNDLEDIIFHDMIKIYF